MMGCIDPWIQFGGSSETLAILHLLFNETAKKATLIELAAVEIK